jgi:integrase
MASFRKTKNGYEVRIKAKGLTRSKTVSTRQEGRLWASRAYQELLEAVEVQVRIPTLLELIERYEKEVCPRHKGCRQEVARLGLLAREPFVHNRADQVTTDIVRSYKDRLVKSGNSNATVNLKLSLLSAIYKAAHLDWNHALKNPVEGVRRPAQGHGRYRRLADAESLKIEDYLETRVSTTFASFIRLALATGMRRSEILGLSWEAVDLDRRLITLKDSKNSRPRWIPIDESAMKVLLKQQRLNAYQPIPMTASAVASAWRRMVKRLELTNLCLHDLRHEALSQWAERLNGDPYKLCLISGHRTLQMTHRYVNPIQSELLSALMSGDRNCEQT